MAVDGNDLDVGFLALGPEFVTQVFFADGLVLRDAILYRHPHGRQKLAAYGIAPPVGKAGRRRALFGEPERPICPRCGSEETERLAEFGSTACKALYRCRVCREPFDYFKCH